MLVHSGDFIIKFAIRKDCRIFFLGFAKRDGFIVVLENRFKRFDIICVLDWRRGGLSFVFVFLFLQVVFFNSGSKDCEGFLFTFTGARFVSAILATLGAFVPWEIPLNVAIKKTFSTLMVMIYWSRPMCSIKPICVFIPNAVRNLRIVLLSKDLLFLREERKNLLKEHLVDSSKICGSSTGSKE